MVLDATQGDKNTGNQGVSESSTDERLNTMSHRPTVRLPLCAVLHRGKLLEREVSLLYHDDVWVKMDRTHLGLERCGVEIQFGNVRAQLVGKTECKHIGWVARGSDVFADENTSWADVREHFLEGHHLLFRVVTPVIDQNIQDGHFLPKSLPERPVGLVPDVDRRVRVFVYLALRLDIHPVDLASLAEIVPPHEHAAAAVHADLNDRHIAADELPEVAVIDLEVVAPLPYPRPLLDALEICSQGIGAIVLPPIIQAPSRSGGIALSFQRWASSTPAGALVDRPTDASLRVVQPGDS